MRTRLACERDVPAITAIYNDAIERTIASFWTEPRPEGEVAQRFADSGERYPWVVAEDADDGVVGVAWTQRWNPRQAYDLTIETSVYVAESSRGRGVGRTLYTDLFERLRGLGYRRVLAGVAVPNDASVRLHESMGMRRVALFEGIGVKFNRYLDVGYWQLDLAE